MGICFWYDITVFTHNNIYNIIKFFKSNKVIKKNIAIIFFQELSNIITFQNTKYLILLNNYVKSFIDIVYT